MVTTSTGGYNVYNGPSAQYNELGRPSSLYVKQSARVTNTHSHAIGPRVSPTLLRPFGSCGGLGEVRGERVVLGGMGGALHQQHLPRPSPGRRGVWTGRPQVVGV